ncbi:hypothetical protein HDU67_001526, partial [Dinochytrium kinnereticum]
MALTQANFIFPPSPAGCKLNAEWTADMAKTTLCEERNAVGLMKCKNTNAGWEFTWSGNVTWDSAKRSSLYEEIRQV